MALEIIKPTFQCNYCARYGRYRNSSEGGLEFRGAGSKMVCDIESLYATTLHCGFFLSKYPDLCERSVERLVVETIVA